MRVRVRFGRHGRDLTIPEGVDVSVLGSRPMRPLGDPARAVADALDDPVGSGRVEEEARGCSSACILVCDVTRPVPNGLVLRPLVERLMAGGVPAERITVLVATGLHRPNQGAELAEVIGDAWVLDRVRVENHFARRDEDHVALGETSGGVPVALDRRFLEAGVRIAVGLVEPHFMAGYSGGRKLITPGIAHASTIQALHSARILGHPRAGLCMREGNPVHEAQEEVLRMVGRALAVNFVIDEGRRPCYASFGEIRVSHGAAVSFLEGFCRIPVERPFAAVVTSAAGHPLDATYYQTVKAIVGAASIVSAGGTLLTVSECAEGLGSADFRASQERLVTGGSAAFSREALGKPRADVDEWETVMLLKALNSAGASLYAPGLPSEDRKLTGVRVVDSPEDEIRRIVEASPDARLAVIPEGPYVVPYLA